MSHFLRSQAIYSYILQCCEQNNLPPTMREIAVACHLPLTTIFRHLDWLETRGYISRGHTSRSLRPIKLLLTDEELVYTKLLYSLKSSDLVPSLNWLCQTTHLSSSRVKAALCRLMQSGRIQSDPNGPRLFYPIEPEK
jgi:SOS-response transcriptional repressor LexA